MIHSSHTAPQIYINTGKGGVGKSSITVSSALYKALILNEPTLIVDADGGVAGARVLQHDIKKNNIIEPTTHDNLSFASIQYNETLQSLKKMKGGNKKFDQAAFDAYVRQYPKDYGLVVFNDMLYDFFGAATDVEGVYSFISLVNVIQDAIGQGYRNIHIDVEPTTGFKRLINSADRIAESIENLAVLPKWKLAAMSAAGWTDIKNYLDGEYFDAVRYYKDRIVHTKNSLVAGNFGIVSIPEISPVQQATGEVAGFIDSIKGNISALFMNNMGMRNAALEQRALDLAHEKMQQRNVPVKMIPHDPRMLEEENRKQVLLEMGEKICAG